MNQSELEPTASRSRDSLKTFSDSWLKCAITLSRLALTIKIGNHYELSMIEISLLKIGMDVD